MMSFPLPITRGKIKEKEKQLEMKQTKQVLGYCTVSGNSEDM